VRFIRVALLALLAALAVLALGFSGEDPAGTCAGRHWCPAVRLPASMTIATGRASYRIARDGRVSRIHPPRRPYPRAATWFPGTGTWFEIRHVREVGRGRVGRGYLVVGRGTSALWRSREQMAADQLGLIAAGSHAVAFQHNHRLYIAVYGGAERPVAARELPLGWTTDGLYTYSYPRRELLLRSDGGALEKVIARRPVEYEFDLTGASLYFLSHGVLMVAHGAHMRRLASLGRLGMSTDTWLQPLGPLVELLDDRHLVLVRRDGSRFASTPMRKLDRISSFLAVPSHAGAVAFTAMSGPAEGPNAETVYLLRAGARAARAVLREPGSFGGCAQWASVEWHGSWLLYSNNDGNLVAIETAGARRALELSGLARQLLGVRQGFDAHWSS
jgi:hypothetical protein